MSGASERSAVISTVVAAAWVQEVIRVLGSATNLSLAHTSIVVHGLGPIGERLAYELRAMGARVTVSSPDPIALLRLNRSGFATCADPLAAVFSGAAISSAAFSATLIFATGESAEPLDASDRGASNRGASNVDMSGLDVAPAADSGIPAGTDAPTRYGTPPHSRTVVAIDAALPGHPRALADHTVLSHPVLSDPVLSHPATQTSERTGLKRLEFVDAEVYLLDAAAVRGPGFDAAAADIRSAFTSLLAQYASTEYLPTEYAPTGGQDRLDLEPDAGLTESKSTGAAVTYTALTELIRRIDTQLAKELLA